MATKIHHHPEFEGAGQFSKMMELILDPQRYDQKFRALMDLREECNKYVDGVKHLNEIEDQYRRAEQIRRDAEKYAEDKRKEIDNQVAKEKNDVQVYVQSIKKAKAQIEEKEAQITVTLEDKKREIGEKENALAEREKAVAARDNKVREDRVQLDKEYDELRAKQQEINKILGG